MEQLRKALHDSPYARWGIRILVGFILSVNYYFYDAFSSLRSLLTKELGFTNTHYGLFVSFAPDFFFNNFGILLKWENSRRNFGVELPLNKK